MKTVTIKTPDFKQSFQIELATAQDMTHAIDHYSFTEDGNIKEIAKTTTKVLNIIDKLVKTKK